MLRNDGIFLGVKRVENEIEYRVVCDAVQTWLRADSQ